MSEKKVKKVTKAKAQQSPIVIAARESSNPEKVVSCKIGDQNFDVKIKQHVEFSIRSAIIDNVESIYFPAGSYDPHYGDELLEFLIIQVYTDMEFNNDFESFDELIGKSYEAYELIIDNMPAEAIALIQSAHDIANSLVPAHSMPAAQSVFYDSASIIMDAIRGVADTLTNTLNSAEKSFKGMKADDVRELISAMNFAGKADEGRVAKAVLDFQREKEKRVAIKAEHDSDVPHI